MDSERKLAQSAKGMGRNTEDSLRRPLPRNQRYAPGQKNVQAVPTPAPVLFAGAGMVTVCEQEWKKYKLRRKTNECTIS